MRVQSLKIYLNEDQFVSAEVILPDGNPAAVLVMAHGAGAGMNHPFMVTVAQAFSEVGIATMRYNLLYMEQNKKRPDHPAVAKSVVKAALRQAYERFPTIPILAGGKSFGGRMTSQLLAEETLTFVSGLIFFGFPLHPAGNPGTARAEHLKDVKQPMLFLQGTRDALADWNLISVVCDELQATTLVKVEGGDHSFKVKGKEQVPFLVQQAQEWIHSTLLGPTRSHRLSI